MERCPFEVDVLLNMERTTQIFEGNLFIKLF